MVTGDRQTGRIEDTPTESHEGLVTSSDVQSTPVASPRPSKEPVKASSGKKVASQSKATGKPVSKNGVMCRVMLLDGKDVELEVDRSATGQTLVDKACLHLSLAEKDYFSCTYKDSTGTKFWLNPYKRIDKQMKGGAALVFAFELKFYPTEPEALHEDLTRYLLCLQLRTDVIAGRLPCSFITQALLGSYAVQSDFGDYDIEEHGAGIDYIKDIRFAPGQTDELLEKIADFHKTHRGENPADAETHYVENAKNIALYGVHMYPAKDALGADVSVGVCASGLIIYKEKLRVNRFTWPKIIKIAYKRNNFTVKNRVSEGEVKEKGSHTYVYKVKDYTTAKKIWKLAVEHHAFFRLKEAEKAERANFAPFGSKYRYSGRTQHQTRNADYGRKSGPSVNRKESSKRFRRDNSATNTLERGGPGTTTERKEDKIYVVEGGAATLTLPNRSKRQGNIPVASLDDDDQNVNPVNGHRFGSTDDEEGNLTLLEGGGGSVDYTRVGYSKNPYGTGVSQSGAGYESYGTNRSTGSGRGGPYNDGTAERNRHGPGSLDMHGGLGLYGPDGRPLRDSRGNLIGQNGGGAFEEDQRYEHSLDGASGQGKWGQHTTTTNIRTTTRTYTNSDGVVCTEHKTEKDGVIETRIERKTVTGGAAIGGGDEEFDYDKALGDAIRAVTDVNMDLSVEKIEIQTKSEQK